MIKLAEHEHDVRVKYVPGGRERHLVYSIERKLCVKLRLNNMKPHWKFTGKMCESHEVFSSLSPPHTAAVEYEGAVQSHSVVFFRLPKRI